MKKMLGFLLVVLTLGPIIAYAAQQYNWGNSNGGAWTTPDDTTATVGQPIQIGSGGGANVIAGGAPLTLYSRTLAQLQALTPATTGQLAYCSNCVNTPLAVSSGTGISAWVAVSSAGVSLVPIK